MKDLLKVRMHLACLCWHISSVYECVLHRVGFIFRHMNHQYATLNDQNKALVDLERKVIEISAKKKMKEDILSTL